MNECIEFMYRLDRKINKTHLSSTAGSSEFFTKNVVLLQNSDCFSAYIIMFAHEIVIQCRCEFKETPLQLFKLVQCKAEKSHILNLKTGDTDYVIKMNNQ